MNSALRRLGISMAAEEAPAWNCSFHFSQINCNSLVPLLWRREYSSPFASKEVWFYLSVALLRICWLFWTLYNSRTLVLIA